jgi:hypothetical protein
MPADVMRGETSGERPYPWNNPVSDRHFAQQQGGPTSSRSSRKGRRSRRGMPTLNRRSRSGSRVQIQMPKGMTAPVPTITNGSPSAQEALAAALALRNR